MDHRSAFDCEHLAFCGSFALTVSQTSGQLAKLFMFLCRHRHYRNRGLIFACCRKCQLHANRYNYCFLRPGVRFLVCHRQKANSRRCSGPASFYCPVFCQCDCARIIGRISLSLRGCNLTRCSRTRRTVPLVESRRTPIPNHSQSGGAKSSAGFLVLSS